MAERKMPSHNTEGSCFSCIKNISNKGVITAVLGTFTLFLILYFSYDHKQIEIEFNPFIKYEGFALDESGAILSETYTVDDCFEMCLADEECVTLVHYEYERFGTICMTYSSTPFNLNLVPVQRPHSKIYIKREELYETNLSFGGVYYSPIPKFSTSLNRIEAVFRCKQLKGFHIAVVHPSNTDRVHSDVSMYLEQFGEEFMNVPHFAVLVNSDIIMWNRRSFPTLAIYFNYDKEYTDLIPVLTADKMVGRAICQSDPFNTMGIRPYVRELRLSREPLQKTGKV